MILGLIDDVIEFLIDVFIRIDFIDVVLSGRGNLIDGGIDFIDVSGIDGVLDVGRELGDIRHEEGTGEKTGCDDKDRKGEAGKLQLDAVYRLALELFLGILTLPADDDAFLPVELDHRGDSLL